MRLCPSVEGSGSPLITHRIGVDVCLARQDSNYHKCHRCVYRGQAATWEMASPPLAMLNLRGDETGDIEVKTTEIVRPTKKQAKLLPSAKVRKPTADSAAQAAS